MGSTMYDPAGAWRRAGVYFAVCLVIGWMSGALDRVLSSPVVDHPTTGAFWLSTAGCLMVVVVAYWVIWPLGTLTHGRRFRPAWHLGFGVLWGVFEGVLFVSIFTVANDLIDQRWWAAGASLLVISGFKGVWHDKYWDIRVSPEHNIVEWNAPKVFFCHVPNLTATLSYLTVFRAPLIFIGFQVVALSGSTLFMRFPSPFDPPTTAMG